MLVSQQFRGQIRRLTSSVDLHQGKIAFEIPDLDGKPEEDVMMALGVPRCVPAIHRDQAHQTDSLPRYLVIPGILVNCVKQGDTRVKILDLGEGSSRYLQLYH